MYKNDLPNFVSFSSGAFANRLCLQILRLPTGVDFSDLQCEIGSPSMSTPISANNSEIDLRAAVQQAAQKPFKRQLMHVDSNLHMDTMIRSASSNSVSIVVPQLREFSTTIFHENSKIAWHLSLGLTGSP